MTRYFSRALRTTKAGAQRWRWWCAADPGSFQTPESGTVPAQGRDKGRKSSHQNFAARRRDRHHGGGHGAAGLRIGCADMQGVDVAGLEDMAGVAPQLASFVGRKADAP